MAFPDEFDAATYRDRYLDLSAFDSDALFAHYNEYGKTEGRIAASIYDRSSFLNLLSAKAKLLEIGVFDSPSLEFLRENASLIHYADWLSKEELVQRAKIIPGRDYTKIPDIRWVLSAGYEMIDIKYDAVVSHHCVEHQPDLVGHFINIGKIINEDGWYFFSLPDKRFCFDHYIPNSNIVDALDAYFLQRKSPSFKSVLEHRCFTSHGFQDGINPYNCKSPTMVQRFRDAFDEFSSNSYVDVHCWIFTPDSFRDLFNQLVDLSILPKYRDFKVYPGVAEFYVAIAF